MPRGLLDDELTNKMQQFLKHEVTVRHLRLLPYLHHCMINGQKVSNINSEESGIIKQWMKDGHLTCLDPDNTLSMSKEFWDFTNEILFINYANNGNDHNEKLKCIRDLGIEEQLEPETYTRRT